MASENDPPGDPKDLKDLEDLFGPKAEEGGRGGVAGGPRMPPAKGPLPLGGRRPPPGAMAAAGIAIVLGVFGGVALLEWGPDRQAGADASQQAGGLGSATFGVPTLTSGPFPSVPQPLPSAPSLPATGSSSTTIPSPSPGPSSDPQASPSVSPTVSPSVSPTLSPSVSPSASPSVSPSASPSISPTVSPSISPSLSQSSSSGGITLPLPPLPPFP